MAKYSLEIEWNSPLHDRLCKRISSRVRMAMHGREERKEKWQRAEELTLAFVPEQEADVVRRLNRTNSGIPAYTTIQVPYSFAVLMSAHTYWTSVFFSRSPIHQFSGRHGEAEMQVQAMEALISYQVEVGQALGPYYIWLYDAGKYGCGVLGHYWERERLQCGQLVSMADPITGEEGIYQATIDLEGYVGNKVFNVSPWDFMHDPRFSLKEFQKGEFCCRRLRMSWNRMKQRQDWGYYNKNVDKVTEHTPEQTDTNSNSNVLIRPQWSMSLYSFLDDGTETKHPGGSDFWEVYIDLIPKEWGLGSTNLPQKWCFTITSDLGLIIGASPLGYYHCQFPFDVAECEVEGYGLYTRGMPEIMEPIQNTMDWLINTHFYNVRAALNNQFIVDPSKLVIKDVQNSGPGFVWRLRPEAYGADLKTMFMQVPVQDVTRTHMADFQSMLGIGEKTLGVNDQIMGALSQGGRKTATEVRTSTGFGVNRMKTVTEYMSATAFSPHAQKLVQTSQQMYDGMAKLRRVGSFALEAGQQFIMVSPQDIAGFFDLVPVDGTLPVDRMAQANLWKEIFAQIRNMPPQVQMGYDWGRIFAWAAQLGGLRNINQFKIQVMPDQMLQAQAQQGNVVPIGQAKKPKLPGGPSMNTQMGYDAMVPQGVDLP